MTNQEADNVRNSRLAIEATQRESCEDEDIAKAFQLGLAFGLDEKHNEMDKTLQQEPCDIQKLKAGDTVLVKCKVEAVFTNSQMVMVTTRDCDQGFDAYTDEIVCVCQDNIKQIKQQPCGDCISRQAVLEQINCWIGSGEYKYTNATYYLTKRMQDLPSVTPQQKMEHWIEHIHNGMHYIECPKCSSWFLRMYLTRNSYCPNCGCKMREVEE